MPVADLRFAVGVGGKGGTGVSGLQTLEVQVVEAQSKPMVQWAPEGERGTEAFGVAEARRALRVGGAGDTGHDESARGA